MHQLKSILVTRSLAEVPLLEAFCAKHQIKLIAESFIGFSAVEATIPANIEVLFFGSKQAVDFFFNNAPAASTKAQQPAVGIQIPYKIACIGSATAAHLQKLGYTVDFAGTKSGDPDSVAKELKSWLGNRKLHIALSEQSKRSISKNLPAGQTEEIIVYQTVSVPKIISETVDLIAFTSPSNLEGYLKQNAIHEETTIVAWGKTTEKALNALNCSADFVLGNASETELISILESLI